MTDLYREEILEHWQNPMNFGVMRGADLVIEQVNPLCGDEVTFYFKFSKENLKSRKLQRSQMSQRIIDVKFTGRGCAISTASASILSEKIKGESIDVISKITGEDIFELLGGPVAPARLKCAFLPLEVLKKMTRDR